MKFLRNPEMKKAAVVFAALTLIFVFAGFVISDVCGIFAAVVCAIFAIVYFFSSVKRYGKMIELTQSIDKVLHGAGEFKINGNREGELSILENEAKKMVIVLREQANELKKEKKFLSDSIADISHQLRTPLTSINLVLTLLQSPNTTEERRLELIAELTGLIRGTDKLVTTLLKISKIDAETVIFEKKQVNVSQLISKAAQPLAVMLDLRGQTLNVDVGDETYVGDFLWSQEAVGNILKNCSEHTPDSGTISVKALQTPIFTEIIIFDDGNGIDPDDLPHIFERFYKGKNSSSDGFGVGLALAKAIISNQNGTIKAENRREGGAKFTIKFYHSQTNDEKHGVNADAKQA